MPPLVMRECHVWRASTTFPVHRLEWLLCERELERARSYARAADRARFTIGAALVRLVVAHYVAARPERVCIDRRCERCGGYHGKTRVSGHPDIDVSVTHSGLRVLAAAARGLRVGIDTELVREDIDVDLLADSVLAESERAVLETLDGRARAHRFLKLWTRKEAVVKALGSGISGPPGKIDESALDVRDVRCGADYVASLAMIGDCARVLSLNAEPLLHAATTCPTSGE